MTESLLAAVRSEAHALDRTIAAWSAAYTAGGKRLFCGTGCAGCCTLFVQSTLGEALLVAQTLDQTQLRALEAYVLRQRDALAGESDLLAALRLHRKTIGPCPFLDAAGSCGVYALRPLACRALLSTKPSAWCGVDFAELDSLDKRLYLDSLDRDVVAFPVHYAAAPQTEARSAEERLCAAMRATWGFSVVGNFPLLVHLERSCALSSRFAGGIEQVLSALQESGFCHPLLLRIESTD